MPTVNSATAILIRVDPELKRWVEQEARENDRSMSAEIRRMIQEIRRLRLSQRCGEIHHGAVTTN